MGLTLFDWHKFNKAAPLVIDDGNRNRCWFYAMSFFFLESDEFACAISSFFWVAGQSKCNYR